MKLTAPSWRRLSVELSWLYAGSSWRVTAWPEVSFQRRTEERWVEESPEELCLASAAKSLTLEDWERYLDYMPRPERTLVEQFRFGRLAALQLLARCPLLFADLQDTPSLVPFLTHHRFLRGSETFRWAEISALHERSGLYGVLEWLGLPASPQTLRVLRNVADPDLPWRLLEPIRTTLWEPNALFVLQKSPALDDRKLSRLCHALAA